MTRNTDCIPIGIRIVCVCMYTQTRGLAEPLICAILQRRSCVPLSHSCVCAHTNTQTCTYTQGECVFKCIDTPGLNDSEGDDEHHINKIIERYIIICIRIYPYVCVCIRMHVYTFVYITTNIINVLTRYTPELLAV